jgi:glycosyltransferase involved in cell wall biosynthesis
MSKINYKISEIPLVTVYITCFNYRAFVEQAINSVLNQTLQNFEIIVIDDGSSDGSQEVIRAYELNPRIRCLFQNNKGLNITNNIAIRAARGRYIMRLDADDWLDPHALEIMSNFLERNHDVGLVFSDYHVVDRNGELIEQVRRHSFDMVSLYDQPAHGACTLIRCECLRELGGYDESFTCQDGYDIWIRFIEHYKVKNVNLPLFYYRQHGNNLTRNEERILVTRAEIIRKFTESKRDPLKVLAVIAVRGANVDPRCLSMRMLGSKRLIDYSIEAACGSDAVHKVIVDTPDEELYEYVNNLDKTNLQAIRRPIELGRENTPIRATLHHALETAELDANIKYSTILQLSVESPFRSARHISSAIRVMELFETDVVIGVRQENDNFYKHDGNGLMPVNMVNQLRLERDDVYREVGSMRLLSRSQVLEENDAKRVKIGHIVLDQKAAIRLSTPIDWNIAEFLLERE